MKKLSLRERLLKYLVGARYWVSGGELQRLTILNTTYTGKTCSRRLQELAEEGLLVVEIRKGHAFYKARDEFIAPKESNPKQENQGRIAFFDSYPVKA